MNGLPTITFQQRNPAATLPPGVEFPRSYFIPEMRFASKDIRTDKNMPRWTTLSCALHPNPDEQIHPVLARRSQARVCPTESVRNKCFHRKCKRNDIPCKKSGMTIPLDQKNQRT